MQDGKAIRIGDPMFGKYRSTPGWYECKVVGEADGGRRLVEWEDGDKEDTLKEPRHLKPLEKEEGRACRLPSGQGRGRKDANVYGV